MADQWKNELKNAFDKKKSDTEKKQQNISQSQNLFIEFIEKVARPAMEEVAVELKKYGLETRVGDNKFNAVGITIIDKNRYPTREDEFRYTIELPNEAQWAHPILKIRAQDRKTGTHHESEGPIKSGSQDYTVKDITKEDVIQSLTSEYNLHIT